MLSIIYNIIITFFFLFPSIIRREPKRIPCSPNQQTCRNCRRTICIWTTWSSKPTSACASTALHPHRWPVCLTAIRRWINTRTRTTAVVSSLTVYQTFQVPHSRHRGSSRSRWSWTGRLRTHYTTWPTGSCTRPENWSNRYGRKPTMTAMVPTSRWSTFRQYQSDCVRYNNLLEFGSYML